MGKAYIEYQDIFESHGVLGSDILEPEFKVWLEAVITGTATKDFHRMHIVRAVGRLKGAQTIDSKKEQIEEKEMARREDRRVKPIQRNTHEQRSIAGYSQAAEHKTLYRESKGGSVQEDKPHRERGGQRSEAQEKVHRRGGVHRGGGGHREMEQQARKKAEERLLREEEEAKKKEMKEIVRQEAVEEIRKEEQARKEEEEAVKRRSEEAEQIQHEAVRRKAEEEARREAEEKTQLRHFVLCQEQVCKFVKSLQTPHSIKDSRVLVDCAIAAMDEFRPALTKCKRLGLLDSIDTKEHKTGELAHEVILSVAERLVQSTKGNLGNHRTPPHQSLENCCDLLKLVQTISECVPLEAPSNAAIGTKCTAMARELCDEAEAMMVPIVMKLPTRTKTEADTANGLRLKLQMVFTEGKHAQGNAHLQQCLEWERNLDLLLAQVEKAVSATMCDDLSTANLGGFDRNLSRIAATLSTCNGVKFPVSDTAHTRLKVLQNDLEGAYERRAMLVSDTKAKLDGAVHSKHLPTLAKVYGEVMAAVSAPGTSMQQVHVQARVPADMQEIGDRLKHEMSTLLPIVLDDRQIDERGAQEAVEAFKRVFANDGSERNTVALLWEGRNNVLECKAAAESAHEMLDEASSETNSTASSASLQNRLHEAINCLQNLNEAVQRQEKVLGKDFEVKNTMKEEQGILADAAGGVLYLREQLAGEHRPGALSNPVC
jgi:hypothetical protein